MFKSIVSVPVRLGNPKAAAHVAVRPSVLVTVSSNNKTVPVLLVVKSNSKVTHLWHVIVAILTHGTATPTNHT